LRIFRLILFWGFLGEKFKSMAVVVVDEEEEAMGKVGARNKKIEIRRRNVDD
jgi:hypothetical protein